MHGSQGDERGQPRSSTRLIDLKHAFRTESLSLGDAVGIFFGSDDPTVEDVNGVPLGSLFLRTDGQVYRKVAQPAEWEALISSVRMLQATDGGLVPFLMIPDPDVPGRFISVNSERYAFFETKGLGN